MHLESLFPQKSEFHSGREFKPLHIGPQRYWGVATSFPIVHSGPAEDSGDLSVLRNRKPLKYSEAPLPGAWSWRRIQGERKIYFSEISSRKRIERKFIPILNRGQSYETTLVLPSGKTLFKLAARSGDPDAYLPLLSVEFNSRAASGILVGSGWLYQITAEAGLGENHLKISFPYSQPLSRRPAKAGQEFLYLRDIEVKVESDLILVSPPQDGTPLEGEFEIRYIPEPVPEILPVSQTLSQEKSIEQSLTFESGGPRMLEFLFPDSRATGTIRLRLGEKKVREFRISSPGGFSFSTMAEPEKLSEIMSLDFLAAEKGPAPDDPLSRLFLDSILVRDAEKTVALPLYSLRDSVILDRGMGPNPYGIKKKLEMRGEFYNSLFVPPRTELRFRVKIPERGIFQFGYGLIKDAWKEEGDGALFEVRLRNAGGEKTLFSASLNPFKNPQHRNAFFKTLDLSPFQNQAVTISMKTDSPLPAGPEGRTRPDFANDLAVWLNPIIYERTTGGAPGPLPTNAILISLDTLRADHLGCYGYPLPTSPAIDRLAADGVLFQNVYSQAPHTLSAHMSMLTGLYPMRHQVLYLNERLNPQIPTLAEQLRARGYLTAAFTGGGPVSSHYGFSKGFDVYNDAAGANYLQNSAANLFQKAAEWIGANRDLKFFLFLHTFQTHNPYLSPAPFGQMFLKNHHPWKGVYLQKILGQGFPRLFARLDPVQRENLIALYDGEIRYADEAFVQPLLQELRRLGLYDRTLIILTSDHGEEFYDHSSWEHSHTLYDELIRVPLIVKFPESGHQGKKIPNLVRSVDIAPTILEITRAGDSGMEMDGESVLPLLKNRKTKERLGLSLLPHRMIAFIPQKMAIIEAGRKFIVNRDFEPQAYQYFTPPPPRLDPFELYDLVRDPSEKNNRAGRETAEVRVLFRRAEKLFRMQEGKLKSQKILLDKELEDQLRTLGYIK